MKKTISWILLLVITITLGSCSSSSMKDGNYYGENAFPYQLAANEQYTDIEFNKFISADDKSTQAFSLKVDTAAYSNISRLIKAGNKPPKDAVRTEELINYFNYDAEMPLSNDHPFSALAVVGKSPLSENRHLAYIRIKTPSIEKSELPPSNLTFLLDTSGSMLAADKLPLLQKSFSLLVENLTEKDVVSIVTYAGSSKVLLDSAEGSEKERILSVINSLEAGGSTAGADGIKTAYALAKKNFIKNGNNRVILASDGDFNVGISDVDKLKDFISEKRDTGLYLSVLGFGTGNLRDDIMETLATNGNGNYSYIDTLFTAEKVLVEEMGANLFIAANDVKAELRFNKNEIKEFRLIGYENRLMTEDEFNDNKKDAGEIGNGTDVVIMVELTLKNAEPAEKLFDVCIRYKTADESKTDKEMLLPVTAITSEPDSDFNFACSVAGFAEILRDSGYCKLSLQEITDLTEANLSSDAKGYRTEFVKLLKLYSEIKDKK